MSNPHLKANVGQFDQDAAASGSYAYTTARLSARLANQRLSRAVQELFSCAGKRILDIGSGDGTYTLELARQGAASVLGIDPAQSAVEAAQQKAQAAGLEHVRFADGDVYNLGLAERFDCAVLRGVLHHLPDAPLALKALAPVCDRLLIVEANGSNPVVKLLEKLSRYHVEHEEQSFRLGTMRSWLNAAGMRIEFVQYVNLVPMFCPDWLARLCKLFEPLAERLPLLRTLCCGQYVILAVNTRAD